MQGLLKAPHLAGQVRDSAEARVAALLRSAEEAALAMGLHRLARLAAEPG